MNAEGWYVDPFGSHEARWFSDGAPTSLVRDMGQVARDEPPNATYEGTLTPIDASGDGTPDDLQRADHAEEPYSSGQGVRAVLDFFDRLPLK